MTVIYTLEITMELEDYFSDSADKCVCDNVLMQMWLKKVEKETAKVIPDANINCTKIQVFDEK